MPGDPDYGDLTGVGVIRGKPIPPYAGGPGANLPSTAPWGPNQQTGAPGIAEGPPNYPPPDGWWGSNNAGWYSHGKPFGSPYPDPFGLNDPTSLVPMGPAEPGLWEPPLMPDVPPVATLPPDPPLVINPGTAPPPEPPPEPPVEPVPTASVPAIEEPPPPTPPPGLDLNLGEPSGQVPIEQQIQDEIDESDWLAQQTDQLLDQWDNWVNEHPPGDPNIPDEIPFAPEQPGPGGDLWEPPDEAVWTNPSPEPEPGPLPVAEPGAISNAVQQTLQVLALPEVQGPLIILTNPTPTAPEGSFETNPQDPNGPMTYVPPSPKPQPASWLPGTPANQFWVPGWAFGGSGVGIGPNPWVGGVNPNWLISWGFGGPQVPPASEPGQKPWTPTPGSLTLGSGDHSFYQGMAGDPVTVTIDWCTNLGSPGIFNGQIDWGDGNSAGWSPSGQKGSRTFTHTYAAAGAYTVTVSLGWRGPGGSVTTTIKLTVIASATRPN